MICNGLDISESGWYGSKEGAKRISAWKWLKTLFHHSAANIDIYYAVVQKFVREMVDIGSTCRVCGENFEIETLWFHLEDCVRQKKLGTIGRNSKEA
jgi:hypothetical protein